MSNESWINELTKIINKLTSHRDIEPFLHPVDYDGLGLIDYLKIIQYPMDFNTIQKNLKKNIYRRREECIRDIKLIFQNAMLYNHVILIYLPSSFSLSLN